MKFLFITGSRNDDFDDEALMNVLRNNEGAFVVHGDCMTGADRLAERYASKHPTARLTTIPMPADWERFGRSAGPIRNSWMVEMANSLRGSGHDVAWCAFPGPNSKGTHDCVRKARQVGFQVEVYEP